MIDLPKTECLLLEYTEGWLSIWFNTPENRNALSDKLSDELRHVLHTVHDNREVRGITLRGKGGVFCAGADLKGFKSNFHSDADDQEMSDADAKARFEAVKASSRSGGELFALINTMPQPVIILVEGAAMAGGLGITCCADIVAVTKDAKFALTETTLGIPPAQIAPYIVQRFGLSTARRLMLSAARFTGAEAKALGLADYVAEDVEGLEAYEAEIKKGVLRCAPGANAVTKSIVLDAPYLQGDAMLDRAAEGFAECMVSAEAKEGISAFVEKRKPSWVKG